jgi:hypothetical protein
MNVAPVIQGFDVELVDGEYVFFGSVVDDTSPVGLTITFGGILSGQVCYVRSDGTFSFSISLSTSGTVTSITQDAGGLWSSEELTYI